MGRSVGALEVSVATLVAAGCSTGPALPPSATTTTPVATSVTLPYVVEAIVYQPPFNKSGVMYRSGGTLGTRTLWDATDPLGHTLAVNVTGTPPIDPRTKVAKASDGMVVTDMSGLGITLDNPPTCEAQGAGCDPNTIDPNHQADSFSILFGVAGRFDQTGDAATYTFDLSTGTPATLNARELYALAQDAPDYSVFCTDAGCDTETQHLAEQYFKSPQDARQILGMNPYALALAVDSHPARFAPGCSSAGDCTAPWHISMNQSPPGPQTATVAVVPQAHPAMSNPATADDPIARVTLAVQSDPANPVLGVVRVTYFDVTAAADFDQRSANMFFQNTSHCERGDIDLWFDKAFGSFLWITQMTNVCTP